MKHVLHKTISAAALGLAMSSGASAANLAFEYTDPSEFRDLRATDTSQDRFEQRVLKELEAHFRNEAAMLPEGQNLRVTLTDLDLAGFIEYPSSMRWPMGLRVVRNLDFPQMNFTYEVRDASGELLSSGEEKLRDLSFRSTMFVNRDTDALRYEKALISDWFHRTFGS
jgi:hypothetical protein